MYKKVELLNKELHKNSALKAIQDLSFAKELISAPLTAGEFFQACKDYPIVFTKDEKNGWSANAIFGYKEKQNLFLDANNKWELGRYIPAFIRRYPFLMIEQKEQAILAFDGVLLSEDEADKERRFFSESGEPTKMTQEALGFVQQYAHDQKETQKFIELLDKWGLLEESAANIVNKKGEKYSLNALYIISEEKLQHLSKKKQSDICEKQAYPLITAHLISLGNIQRLGLKEE